MFDNKSTQSGVVQRRSESLLSQHTVLRNTYFLLSLTLLFSGAMAGLSMMMNISHSASILLSLIGFGLLFAVMAARNSVWGLVLVFAFTGTWGFSLGPLLNAYIQMYANGHQLILTALGGTGVIFLALSSYVLTSKKDFSYLGGFLFTALIGVVIASIVGIFFHAPMLQIIISAATMLIFSGFILYDTHRIISGGETNYIMATVSLFLDIVNLFLALLRLLSAFSGNRN